MVTVIKEKACKTCKRVTEKAICPNCGGNTLSQNWGGLLIVIDAQNSEISKEVNITSPGKYALRVE